MVATKTVRSPTTMADAAIQYALNQVGKPYVWAATGPNSYDCSGLIVASYRHAGYKFPMSRPFTGTLIVMGANVPESDLAPGDLVFPDPGHVQIYLGNGQIVEASTAGNAVRVHAMWGFWRARRLVPPGQVYTGGATAQTAGFETVANPLSAFSALDGFFNTISDTHFWYRVGIGFLGILAMVIALTSKQSPVPTQAVAKVASKVVSK